MERTISWRAWRPNNVGDVGELLHADVADRPGAGHALDPLLDAAEREKDRVGAAGADGVRPGVVGPGTSGGGGASAGRTAGDRADRGGDPSPVHQQQALYD